MLLYLISRIVSSTGAFLYPTYASYKTLSRRPASEADLERWLMYWSVLGIIVGLEYVAEWTISWIPFYHPLKTLFLLYLALPQTRGASYIYTKHLYPLLASHETEIDAALSRMKEEVYRWVQQRIRGLWDNMASSTARQGGGAPPAVVAGIGGGARGEAGAAAPPTLNDPVSGPVQLAYGFWRSYGPTILASGAAFLQSKAAPQSQAQPSTSSPPGTPPSSRIPPPSSQLHAQPSGTWGATSAINVHAQDAGAILARRRALEAELASLPLPNPHEASAPASAPAFPIPRPASSTYLPTYGDERGRYEEIGRDEADAENHEHEAAGTDVRPEAGARRSSWWWGGGDGYERVKTE